MPRTHASQVREKPLGGSVGCSSGRSRPGSCLFWHWSRANHRRPDERILQATGLAAHYYLPLSAPGSTYMNTPPPVASSASFSITTPAVVHESAQVDPTQSLTLRSIQNTSVSLDELPTFAQLIAESDGYLSKEDILTGGSEKWENIRADICTFADSHATRESRFPLEKMRAANDAVTRWVNMMNLPPASTTANEPYWIEMASAKRNALGALRSLNTDLVNYADRIESFDPSGKEHFTQFSTWLLAFLLGVTTTV